MGKYKKLGKKIAKGYAKVSEAYGKYQNSKIGKAVGAYGSSYNWGGIPSVGNDNGYNYGSAQSGGNDNGYQWGLNFGSSEAKPRATRKRHIRKPRIVYRTRYVRRQPRRRYYYR